MSLNDISPTTVSLPNGIRLNYVRAGSGPVVIFIHGAMGDYRSFNPQWDAFSDRFDCISYSRRYSFPNDNPMNARDHNALVDAEDLEGLMEVLKIPSAILVGSSYGGFTALAMAVRAPNRVRALVSVEAPMMRYAETTATGAAIAQAFKAQSGKPARDAFENGDDALGVRILTGGIVGKAPADVPEDVMKRRMVNMPAAKSLALSDDEFPLLPPDTLAALPMPVLLLSGAETADIHTAIFQAVCAAMPQAKSMVIDGSGHSVSQQASETFNAVVLSFLNDHIATAA